MFLMYFGSSWISYMPLLKNFGCSNEALQNIYVRKSRRNTNIVEGRYTPGMQSCNWVMNL